MTGVAAPLVVVVVAMVVEALHLAVDKTLALAVPAGFPLSPSIRRGKKSCRNASGSALAFPPSRRSQLRETKAGKAWISQMWKVLYITSHAGLRLRA